MHSVCFRNREAKGRKYSTVDLLAREAGEREKDMPDESSNLGKTSLCVERSLAMCQPAESEVICHQGKGWLGTEALLQLRNCLPIRACPLYQHRPTSSKGCSRMQRSTYLTMTPPASKEGLKKQNKTRKHQKSPQNAKPLLIKCSTRCNLISRNS